MSKTFLISVSLFILSFSLLVSCNAKDKNHSSGLQEVSSEIDLENFKPFLGKLTGLIESGFTNSEVSLILSEFRESKHDIENNYDFKITYNGNASIMKIKIIKEDSDIVLFYIFSIPGLSEQIDKALSQLMEEKGL